MPFGLKPKVPFEWNVMELNKKVIQLIFNAIDEFNNELPMDKQIKKSLDTALYADLGEFDSLDLVKFIVTVEQKIEQEFNISLTIADEKAFSLENSPFKTVQSFSDYIIGLLEKNENK